MDSRKILKTVAETLIVASPFLIAATAVLAPNSLVGHAGLRVVAYEAFVLGKGAEKTYCLFYMPEDEHARARLQQTCYPVPSRGNKHPGPSNENNINPKP